MSWGKAVKNGENDFLCYKHFSETNARIYRNLLRNETNLLLKIPNYKH